MDIVPLHDPLALSWQPCNRAGLPDFAIGNFTAMINGPTSAKPYTPPIYTDGKNTLGILDFSSAPQADIARLTASGISLAYTDLIKFAG